MQPFPSSFYRESLRPSAQHVSGRLRCRPTGATPAGRRLGREDAGPRDVLNCGPDSRRGILLTAVAALMFPQRSLGARTRRLASRPQVGASMFAQSDRPSDRTRAACVSALGKPRQAVIGERFPHGGIGDKLPHRRSNAGIIVECAHPDADRLVVARIRSEDRRPARAAEPLLASALRRFPHPKLLLTRDDPEGAGSWVRLRRCRGAGSPLTAFAVAVARPDEWLGDFVPNCPTVTAAREPKWSLKRHRYRHGEDSGRSVRVRVPAGDARARAGSTRARRDRRRVRAWLAARLRPDGRLPERIRR